MKTVKTLNSALATSSERAIDLNAAGVFESIYGSFVGLLQFIGNQSRIPVAERDELVQESFLRLFKCGAKFTNEDSVKAFLAVTMRNQIIDRSRRAKTRRTDLESTLETDLSQASTQLWESDTVNDMALVAVAEVINEIASQEGNEVFGWFYRDGLSVKEIAAKTGEAVGSVTSKLCRLRARNTEMIKTRVLSARELDVCAF